MRYIIHGAGAIGGLIGGRLAAGGAEVLLIARQAMADAVNARGLTIRSREGEQQIPGITAVTDPREITPREDDVILLTVKSRQTAAAVQALHEVFGQETPIFCFQNGVRNEEAAAARFRRVYGVMVDVSATLLRPGLIAHTRSGSLATGCYPLGRDELLRQVAADFDRAVLKTTTHDHIMAIKWAKLLLNLNNATHAICDYYVQLSHVLPPVARFMADVIEEGLRVLEVAGISVEEENNPFDVKAHIARLRNLTEDEAAIRAARSLPPDLRTYPSTWADLKHQRGETEAGYFNGEIILLGEKHGLFTPFNSTLFTTVETMALQKQPPGRYTIEELSELVEQKRLELYHTHSETLPQ
ncbi:MAG TPA: 2-dehydropantoate 2-reductase [Blastocatellia bacterium]|nr:2-dehydropantoate 2-reductase [Blastocatellia bacterium]